MELGSQSPSYLINALARTMIFNNGKVYLAHFTSLVHGVTPSHPAPSNNVTCPRQRMCVV